MVLNELSKSSADPTQDEAPDPGPLEEVEPIVLIEHRRDINQWPIKHPASKVANLKLISHWQLKEVETKKVCIGPEWMRLSQVALHPTKRATQDPEQCGDQVCLDSKADDMQGSTKARLRRHLRDVRPVDIER